MKQQMSPNGNMFFLFPWSVKCLPGAMSNLMKQQMPPWSNQCFHETPNAYTKQQICTRSTNYLREATRASTKQQMPPWNTLRWRHNGHDGGTKSPASRLFTRPFIQTQIIGKHQSSASLALVRGIHRGPVNSAHKWPVTRKMFPFDDVIMNKCLHVSINFSARQQLSPPKQQVSPWSKAVSTAL